MKPGAKWGLLVGMLLLMGYVVYGSMARVEQTCELCIEFNGQEACRRGAGATQAEAVQAAAMSACGTLAYGMDESIRCQNTRPRTQYCTGTP